MLATLIVPCILLLLSFRIPEVSALPFLNGRQNLDLGRCGSPEIKYGMGFDQRKDLSYQPVNMADFNHGSDLTIGTIASFICDRLASPCNAPQATLDQCALAQGFAQHRTGGAAADTFNNGMGITTGYAAVSDNNNGTPNPIPPEPTTPKASPPATQNPPPATTTSSQQPPAQTPTTRGDNPNPTSASAPRSDTTGASSDTAGTTAGRTTGISPAPTGIALQEEVMAECKLVAVVVTYTVPDEQVVGGQPDEGQQSRTSTMDFGTCSDPTIMFGAGLDGRRSNEFVFVNTNIREFPRRSDADPAVIMQFTCDNLISQCGLRPEDRAVIICRAAIGPASAFGKHGAAADSFNGALGFRTDFESVIIPN